VRWKWFYIRKFDWSTLILFTFLIHKHRICFKHNKLEFHVKNGRGQNSHFSLSLSLHSITHKCSPPYDSLSLHVFDKNEVYVFESMNGAWNKTHHLSVIHRKRMNPLTNLVKRIHRSRSHLNNKIKCVYAMCLFIYHRLSF
jgi:hypothetical protein